MPKSLPGAAAALAEKHAKVWDAYSALGEAVAEEGPLDERTRRLVKLALAIGRGSEGAVHSHVRRAVEDGLTGAELHHVALMAIPTLGLPSAVAALTWMNDILDKA